MELSDARCEAIRVAALDDMDDDALEEFNDEELNAFHNEQKVLCTGEDDNADDLAVDSVLWEIKRRRKMDQSGEERVPPSEWIEEHAP